MYRHHLNMDTIVSRETFPGVACPWYIKYISCGSPRVVSRGVRWGRGVVGVGMRSVHVSWCVSYIFFPC